MDKSHIIIEEVWSEEGELLAKKVSLVPGEFEPDEMTKKYWTWLDERRMQDG